MNFLDKKPRPNMINLLQERQVSSMDNLSNVVQQQPLSSYLSSSPAGGSQEKPINIHVSVTINGPPVPGGQQSFPSSPGSNLL